MTSKELVTEEGNGIQDKLLKNTKKIEPLTLTWDHINVYTSGQSNSRYSRLKTKLSGNKSNIQIKKQIIDNISGIARAGQVLAILGPSGAGKSTILNILNSRNRGSLRIDGDVRINGRNIDRISNINSICGYVQQHDLFIGTLKVKEHLLFQAMLRMDKNTSKSDRIERIEEVLKDFNLTKCKDSLIGCPDRGIKGISGGEMRRLSFASEIITNPSILFCDEPTSGLDSFMAMSIVESMKNLASTGKTIICTIHQPSSELFEMFDSICFLTEGKLAFIGNQSDAIHFFKNQGFMCPQNYNPADFFIKTLSTTPQEREKSTHKINTICEGFDKSDYTRALSLEKQQINQKYKNVRPISESIQAETSSVFTQIRWLFWRGFIDAVRDSLNLKLQFIQITLIAILYGLIYYRLEMNQTGIQNINGVLFICIMNTTFGTMFGVINTFPKEIPLFVRESQNGMYRVISYFISKLFIEIPLYVFVPLVMISIMYWMTNLNDQFEKYVICSLVLILVAYVSGSYSQFISVISPTNISPNELAIPLLIPFFIFSGFFLHNNTIPPYFLIIKYLSWFGYANEALLINQWSSIDEIECKTNRYLCFLKGDDVLGYFNAKPEMLGYNISMLFFIAIGWKILSYVMLLNRSYKK